MSKASYTPFDAELMLEITPFTEIAPAKVSLDRFSAYIYNITPFDKIITVGPATYKFIDVIGIVTTVSLPKSKCPRGKEHVSTLKEVTIKDLNDAELVITLWGDHVNEFQLHGATPSDPPQSVVALFCGCLPKKIFGKTQVNAGNACRWFLNPNITEAQPFYDRLCTHPVQVNQPAPTARTTDPQVQPRILQHKTLAKLNALDPYKFPQEGCKFPQDQKWWYMGREICKKGLTNESGSYYCTECKWPTAVPRYKFSLLAADDTAEAKFFCHDVVARQIIHRNCDSLLKAIKYAPS